MKNKETTQQTSVGMDLTEGTPFWCIGRFSLPMLAGNLLQYLYTTVDAAVVGRLIGKEALAAVGTCSPIINLMVSLFIGLAMGAGILIAQHCGARDQDGVRFTLQTAVGMTIYVGLIVTVGGLILMSSLMNLLGVEKALQPMAVSYLSVIFGGILISMFYNLAASVLRALGDSKTPLYALVVASILNVVLDVLLVGVFQTGVQGTAWATILSQLISVLYSVTRLKGRGIHLEGWEKSLRLDWRETQRIAKLGFPSAIQQTAYSLGMLVVQGVINRFGVLAMATYVAVMKLDNICSLPVMSFGEAMTTFTGQCVGAGKIQRVEQGGRHGLLLGFAVTIPLSLAMFFFGRWPLMLFTTDSGIIETGFAMLRILCPFYFLLVVIDVRSGQLRGAGNTLIPMLNSSIALCGIRVPIMLLLVQRSANPSAIYWAMVSSCIFGAIFISLYYRFGKWRNKLMTLTNTMGNA